ncbi:hypothetical protein C7391_0690 [Methanimicrococcus blatticola]|uniref:Uncharacterized protein n=1 Tax=Methanimicrococcus blatticola TaxID=91560 RepID=A0A484F6A6_9EURY|nr:hypothetical protein C7391_0690 [Methanimicrococcus blatticola]
MSEANEIENCGLLPAINENIFSKVNIMRISYRPCLVFINRRGESPTPSFTRLRS